MTNHDMENHDIAKKGVKKGMVRKPQLQEREGLGGGKGPARVYHIVRGDELHGIGRMYARIELPPGSYVGWHQHVDDTEPYYILKGKGIFTDNDQSKTEVGPGDVCVIEPGQFHSLENASDTEDLVFMALIYNTDMIRPEK